MDTGLFLKALGLMLVFEGIPYFLNPAGFRATMQWLLDSTSDSHLRFIGLGAMLSGVTLLYLAG